MLFKRKRETLLWVWLSLACKPGSNTFARLLKWNGFSDAKSVYEADDAVLEELFGKSTSALSALKNKELGRAERIVNYCDAMNIRIIVYGEKDYPPSFKAIRMPPVLLYCKGTLPSLDCLKVGVVGARRMTAYGKKHTFLISSALAHAGALIVSGMARGIDGVASAAALYAKGKTVVFLGCGIDRVYPPEHDVLSRAIEHAGAVLSEYPPGDKGDKSCFPVRNRLISALSDCLLVTEGDQKSGALITADAAKRQGKPIFALPGSIDSVMSEAPRLLLKQGAAAADCADDIIRALSEEYPEERMVRVLEFSEPSLETIDSVLSAYGVRKEATPLIRNEEIPSATRAVYKRQKSERKETEEIEEIKEEAHPTVQEQREAHSDDEGEMKIKLGEPMRSVYLAMPSDTAISFDALCERIPSLDGKALTTALSRLSVLGLVHSLSGERYKKEQKNIQ